MLRPDLNIIVCVDKRRCLNAGSDGRNGPALLEELRSSVKEYGLKDRVQVTPCHCILGCTYCPRFDVARRGSGEKVLYGIIDGEVTISIRGRVRMLKIPSDSLALALDNLPEE